MSAGRNERISLRECLTECDWSCWSLWNGEGTIRHSLWKGVGSSHHLLYTALSREKEAPRSAHPCCSQQPRGSSRCSLSSIRARPFLRSSPPSNIAFPAERLLTPHRTCTPLFADATPYVHASVCQRRTICACVCLPTPHRMCMRLFADAAPYVHTPLPRARPSRPSRAVARWSLHAGCVARAPRCTARFGARTALSRRRCLARRQWQTSHTSSASRMGGRGWVDGMQRLAQRGARLRCSHEVSAPPCTTQCLPCDWVGHARPPARPFAARPLQARTSGGQFVRTWMCWHGRAHAAALASCTCLCCLPVASRNVGRATGVHVNIAVLAV
eukprot:352712-Chlamydomonas_euryale.AAC.7